MGLVLKLVELCEDPDGYAHKEECKVAAAANGCGSTSRVLESSDPCMNAMLDWNDQCFSRLSTLASHARRPATRCSSQPAPAATASANTCSPSTTSLPRVTASLPSQPPRPRPRPRQPSIDSSTCMLHGCSAECNA